MPHRRIPILIGALAILGACDRGLAHDAATTSAPAAPTTAAAPAGQAETVPVATSLAAAAAPVTGAGAAAAPARASDCRALSGHVHEVISTKGSARARQLLPPLAEMTKICEGETNDAELTRCFLDASDPAGFDQCNRKPFLREIDATPKRSFSALENNAAVQPPVLTEDGDYLAYDADCGSLYKEVPPAAAVFVACKGKVLIGPMVNADEIDMVFRKLSADEQHRHEIVMSMVSKAATGDFRVPVHVYDANGSYRGVEYR